MEDQPVSSSTPRQVVTEDTIRRVDAALESTGGHRAHAGQLLGMEEKRVHNLINTHEILRAKWGKSPKNPPEPGLAAEMHREEAVMPFSKSEAEIAAAVEAEDDLWRVGYEKLNFTPAKKEFLGAVMNAHGNHWTAVTQMFQGGVSYTATELLFMFHKLEKEIQRTFETPDAFVRTAVTKTGDSYVVKDAHEFRLEMMDRALHIAEMFRKLHSDSERAQLLHAQIEKLKVQDAKSVKKRKQAAWNVMSQEKPVDAQTT